MARFQIQYKRNECGKKKQFNNNEEILFIFYFGFITYLDFVTWGTIHNNIDYL